MANLQVRLVPLVAKTVVVHTVTYFVMGVIAFNLLDYQSAYMKEHMACWMRQFPDPLIMAGPLFQPIRGLVFGLVLFSVRESIFFRKRGWLVAAGLLVGLGILATFGPAPGSLEGLVYTTIPIQDQLLGYLEVIPQAFLLAAGVVYWVNQPQLMWFTSLMGIGFVLATGLPLLGLVTRQ